MLQMLLPVLKHRLQVLAGLCMPVHVCAYLCAKFSLTIFSLS